MGPSIKILGVSCFYHDAAVASLDERCRRLLILLFYRSDTAPYAEVAALLGINEGSIGPTRARCLRKLRDLLDVLRF